MDYIQRDHSLLTEKQNLEHLYTFKDFPVFMGCTNEMDSSDDIVADMSFSICRDTGMIQLDKLLPLDLVYQAQHNDGVGKIWQDHYKAFARFLESFSPTSVLEIGGANDYIARDFLNRNNDTSWTIIEPHPLFPSDDHITVIQGWFNDSFALDTPVDTVVHSHVLEHTYDPISFIKQISSFLQPGGKHVFTFPNMIEMLSRKYTNCLNFEHTAFLAEPFVDYLLATNGFKILKKEYFQDHSIFYATERTDAQRGQVVDLPSRYEEYKKLFMDFTQYHEKLVQDLNKRIEQWDGEIYLFGAHIFSQYLFAFGLQEDRIRSILDNSELKNGKRLYGTTLAVQYPDRIKDAGRPCVILKIGAYREEVMKQLKEIRSDVLLLE